MTEKFQFSIRSLLWLSLWASCGFFLFSTFRGPTILAILFLLAIALQIAGISTNARYNGKAVTAFAITLTFGVINTCMFMALMFGHWRSGAMIFQYATPCVALGIISFLAVSKSPWLNAPSLIGAGIFVISCAMLCRFIYESIAYAA